jgi:hypothetical protein
MVDDFDFAAGVTQNAAWDAVKHMLKSVGDGILGTPSKPSRAIWMTLCQVDQFTDFCVDRYQSPDDCDAAQSGGVVSGIAVKVAEILGEDVARFSSILWDVVRERDRRQRDGVRSLPRRSSGNIAIVRELNWLWAIDELMFRLDDHFGRVDGRYLFGDRFSRVVDRLDGRKLTSAIQNGVEHAIERARRGNRDFDLLRGLRDPLFDLAYSTRRARRHACRDGVGELLLGDMQGWIERVVSKINYADSRLLQADEKIRQAVMNECGSPWDEIDMERLNELGSKLLRHRFLTLVRKEMLAFSRIPIFRRFTAKIWASPPPTQ